MNLLATARLAPIQCATWGHPVTTGSPQMDFYLSSELMEPPDGQEHYSETLVSLPGIGCHYRKPLLPRAVLDTTRERFGLDRNRIVYLCCQSAHKYLPQYDHLLAEIAARVPTAQFAFIAARPEWAQCLRNRLRPAFKRHGLNVDEYCVFQPRLRPFDYWALNLTADVFLDTPGWNGFNTTMEAIACGLPVVTIPGRFMRGRHGLGILTQLGITETIAATESEYVEIAVALGNDPSRRKALVAKMAARHHYLYSDPRSVTALEDFLVEKVRAASESVSSTRKPNE